MPIAIQHQVADDKDAVVCKIRQMHGFRKEACD
jgi:hypothetical protein